MFRKPKKREHLRKPRSSTETERMEQEEEEDEQLEDVGWVEKIELIGKIVFNKNKIFW